ncbi:MAG TPA: EAL domain-containing protein [Zeimonas sp.]|nr:EAL domain-containing protein [Zeimonas sp.]
MRAARSADPSPTATRRGFGLAIRYAAAAALVMALVQGAWWLLAAAGPRGWREQALPLSAIPTTIAAAALAGWWLGRLAGRRLDAVRHAIERIHDADYPDRLGAGARDEIGRLVDSVNRLAESASARERRIMESALSDPLTGLPNRALLADRIRHMVTVSQRSHAAFAIALLDLDRFKVVNDTLGHATGDVLLKEVARRLRATVRDSDTVARLGGDEFVLLMAGGVDAAREVSRRVLEAMKAPLRHGEQLIDIGISIGIALYPDHGHDDVTLLRHADSAMYRAKRTRSGQRVFDGDGGEVRRSDLSLLGEMRAALDGGQFDLDYQPKLAMRTGLIAGVEGLVRWNHPERGRVPPAEFIPFAEQTGFMRELTHWVVERGARFSRALAEAGLDLVVSVNVSAPDIQNAEFAREVLGVLHRASVDPKRLCLEITESGVVSESEAAIRNLRAISRTGVKLSVDDFGTGYATLKQLQQLPVSELKIDRSFVSGLHRNRGNLTIVRSTIELGKQLGLKVVAEGVETVAELRCLARLGCDEAQGYYLSKPMREADVAGWVEMRHALYASSRETYFALLTERR